MPTTHNVTELQPRMTREQLIDAARTAAKYLPVASAQLMNEIATRLDYTSVALCEAMEQRKSLAIENTVLREDATSWAKECDRIVELYTKTRSNMHLLEAQRELRDLTPTTDSFLAEVQSKAREEGAYFVANRMLAAWDAGFIDDTASNAADIARMILTSTEFMADAPEGDFDRSFADGVLKDIAAQLRKGAAQ
ncbi:TPA: hypothetical protein ACNH1H_000398 [Citrobacter koseri]